MQRLANFGFSQCMQTLVNNTKHCIELLGAGAITAMSYVQLSPIPYKVYLVCF